MAKCLVLGANGFIGSHLVDELVNEGYEVRAFGRFQSSETKFNNDKRIEVYPGDYLNRSDIEEALKGIDFVFHFISTTTPATSEDEPLIDIETNVRASVELFQLCVEEGVKRVVYASSGGAIYGNNASTVYKETDITLPVSPYAIGKLTIENYLRYFHVKHSLEYTVFRIANPYGERQPFWRKQGVIPIFLEKVYNDAPLTVLGDGSMVRDYIYVKDVAKMIVATLARQPLHSVYNLGSGSGHSVNELISTIESVAEVVVKRHTQPVPATFMHTAVLDIQRYTDEFNIQPETSLEDGMTSTYQYIQQELKKRVQS